MARDVDQTNHTIPSVYTRRLLDRLAERRNSIGGFRAKANQKRTRAERIADTLTQKMGSVPFLLFHILLFAIWFGVNLGIISGLPPYDQYPFGLLTMLLTLEQSMLTV